MERLAQKLKAKYPERLVLIENGETYIAYEKDAQTIYSIMTNRPIEKLGNIASVVIKKEQLNDIVRRLVRAGQRIAISKAITDIQ